MKYLFTIYIWIFVVIYFIIISSFIIIIMHFLPKHKVYKTYKFLLKVLFKISFINVKVEYEETLDINKNYLFMPNHVSLFDAPLMFAYTPHLVSALEAEEHFSWPIYGKLIKMWGNIPINRKNAKSSYNSMMKGKTVLQESNSLIIFPEGSRTSTGKMKRFKKLPFHIAKKAEASIVPVGVSGIFSVNHKGSFFVKPGTIKIKYGKIVSTKTKTEEELMLKVRNDVEKLIEYL